MPYRSTRFLCQSVRRNDRIRQVLLISHDSQDGEQPEAIVWNTSTEHFVEGRSYVVNVAPVVNERG